MYSPPPLAVPARKENAFVHLGILIALLVILYGVLVYFNILSCSSIHPAVCDIYYNAVAGGKPKILIVSGEDGMGNPEQLATILRSSRFSARVEIRGIDIVSLPLLRDYQLVIVERARTMKIEDMKLFADYVNRGGRLVWVGDAGASAPALEADNNYFLTYAERKSGASGDYIGPWARKSGGQQD